MFTVSAAAGTTGVLHRAEGLVDQTPLPVLLNPASWGLFQLTLIFPFLVTSHFSLVLSGYRESWAIPECSGFPHSQHEHQKILSQIGFLRASGAILGLKGKRANGAQCPLEIQSTSWVTSIDYLNISSPMGGSLVMT